MRATGPQQTSAASRGARRRSLGSQAGEALIESLVAIAILSAIVAATYGGMQVSLRASSETEAGANAGTLLRSAAEQLQNPEVAYIDLAGCGAIPTYGDLPRREGYGAVQAKVGFWSMLDDRGKGTEVAFSEPGSPKGCPDEDPGLQLIELSVATPDGGTETLQVIKGRTR